MNENFKNEERMHGDVKEHIHAGHGYWHPAARVHADITKDKLPVGHVLGRKPLAEKLSFDLVGVTPIQKMEIGKDLEIGAVVSLMEGLKHHRKVASTLITELITEGPGDGKALFYAEWTPNHSEKVHRYLIVVQGTDVYVGYFPWDGHKPRLYGVHHRRQDVIKFLHKTNDSLLQVPELTLLTELNVPNVRFELTDPSPIGAHVTISHNGGSFYTRSIYGEFIPLSECKFVPDPDSGDTPDAVKGHWEETGDATGFNMANPKHPWYMFQGATGYVQLFEGKMFCYPDGSIRFLTPLNEQNMFRDYTDLQIVQGDLAAYEGVALPSERNDDQDKTSLDRHNIKADKVCLSDWGTPDPNATNRYQQRVYVVEYCTLTITHPEHGECKYEARKGEMLALLPGTSRPFQKNTGRD